MVVFVAFATDVLVATGLGCVWTPTFIVTPARFVFSGLVLFLSRVVSFGGRSLNPVHENVLELAEISKFILAGLRDSIADCFVVVNDFIVVCLWKCSKESNDMFGIPLELTDLVREDKGERLCILGEDNLPIS